MTPAGKRSGGPQAGRAAAGAMALVAVCCSGHLLVLGAIGGLALGGALGIGAGALAAVLVVAAAVVVLRRRRGATYDVKADRRLSS